MLKVLEDRKFPVSQLLPVASASSVGKSAIFRGKNYPVIGIQQAIEARPDFVLFSAGSSVSLEWAPRFANQGCYVIDNSSAWRMEPDIPLIVPEVNASHWAPEHHLIANPNCSTIQAVMAVAPLHRAFHLRRLVISTYQSITGTGKAAVDQYINERSEREGPKVYPHPIFANCIPQCDQFMENGYTREEMKMVRETRKILGEQEIGITATAVRVPVYGGHSESVNAEFWQGFEMEEIYAALDNAPGVTVLDDPAKSEYPMPLFAEGKDDVFVGRIRRDDSRANTLNLWIVSDNLRKGAATNAVQIAEFIAESLQTTTGTKHRESFRITDKSS
jgi:aspartate-semialdehyde dehydrogenase